jgi:hypothetical protein
VPLLAVEMLEYGVEICCISEVHRGNEEFVREGFKFFCSGYPDDRKIDGVGVIVDLTVISGEIECHRVSPRIMWIVGGVFKGVKMAIISVYAVKIKNGLEKIGFHLRYIGVVFDTTEL